MKANAFNICPDCAHYRTCVLTTEKSQVWSCSEFDELPPETGAALTSISDNKDQPEMALA